MILAYLAKDGTLFIAEQSHSFKTMAAIHGKMDSRGGDLAVVAV
jgi:hypothetical protein